MPLVSVADRTFSDKAAEEASRILLLIRQRNTVRRVLLGRIDRDRNTVEQLRVDSALEELVGDTAFSIVRVLDVRSGQSFEFKLTRTFWPR